MSTAAVADMVLAMAAAARGEGVVVVALVGGREDDLDLSTSLHLPHYLIRPYHTLACFAWSAIQKNK